MDGGRSGSLREIDIERLGLHRYDTQSQLNHCDIKPLDFNGHDTSHPLLTLLALS